MREQNLPVVRKEGVFTKIKNWFKKIFLEMEETQANITQGDGQDIKKNEFFENIKVESKDTIIALQRKLKENQINISELTDKELDEMIELFKKQISNKKEKLKK